MKIVKRDGRLVEFDPGRIYKVCTAAGATEEIAADVASYVAARVHEGMTTDEIRRLVASRLEEEDPIAAEAYRFYDRLVKGRITLIDGKTLVVKQGTIYMGGRAVTAPPAPLRGINGFKEILTELEEDLRYGVPRRLVAARLRALQAAVDAVGLEGGERDKALEMIDTFRRSLGWPPLRRGRATI